MSNELNQRRKFSKKEKMIVLKKTNNRCGHCGCNLHDGNSTIDHIVPINKGGLNDEYNLVGLCYDCNEDKSNFLYDAMDYYKYILPEYILDYKEYHNFAVYDNYNKTLFGYDVTQYRIYPPKQKQMLKNMMKRKGGMKKAIGVAKNMGVPLLLTRAYTGDATEIMGLIQRTIDSPTTRIFNSYYKNEYVLLDDIKNGEVYVLRGKNDDKICGAFMFKKIKEDDLLLPQIQNISMNSCLKPKYIMTGAYVDYFACDVYNDIMEDIASHMLHRKAIPIYFNILTNSFREIDECISITYPLNGEEGKLEFMPLKYIRKLVEKTAEHIAEGEGEKLTKDEISFFAEVLIDYRCAIEIKHEIEENNNKELEELMKKHPKLYSAFKPEDYELYNVGFVSNLDDYLEKGEENE